MITKEKQERASLIRYLHQQTLAIIVKTQEIQKKKELANIALENQMIRNCNTPSFLFDSAWYLHPYNAQVQSKKGFNRILDSSLYSRVTKILSNSFENTKQTSFISAMVADALQMSKNLYDTTLLLPEMGYIEVQPDAYTIFGSGPAISQQEIGQFKERNQKGLMALSEVNLTNLLLAKVTQ